MENATFGTVPLTMEKSARLSVPAAPPPKPVPELAFSVPRPMTTVSGVASFTLSPQAVKVSATEVAPAPVSGPVKVTVALPELRLSQATPRGGVAGQARW